MAASKKNIICLKSVQVETEKADEYT